MPSVALGGLVEEDLDALEVGVRGAELLLDALLGSALVVWPTLIRPTPVMWCCPTVRSHGSASLPTTV